MDNETAKIAEFLAHHPLGTMVATSRGQKGKIYAVGWAGETLSLMYVWLEDGENKSRVLAADCFPV